MTSTPEPTVIYVVEELEAIDYGADWEAAYCLSYEDAVHFIEHARDGLEDYRIERDDRIDGWLLWDDDDVSPHQESTFYIRERTIYRP